MYTPIKKNLFFQILLEIVFCLLKYGKKEELHLEVLVHMLRKHAVMFKRNLLMEIFLKIY